VRQHRALRPAGGTGGVAIDGNIVLLSLVDFGVEPGVVGVAFAAGSKHVERRQHRAVVVPKAASIDVIDGAQPRHPRQDGEHLVDLLLILANHHRGFGMIEQIPDLVRRGIRISAERARPETERAELQQELLFQILADEREHLAAPEARCRETRGVAPRLKIDIPPVAPAPDAGALAAERGLARVLAGAVAQQLRQRAPARCARIGDGHGADGPHRFQAAPR
jgi:hypothetical protein